MVCGERSWWASFKIVRKLTWHAVDSELPSKKWWWVLNIYILQVYEKLYYQIWHHLIGVSLRVVRVELFFALSPTTPLSAISLSFFFSINFVVRESFSCFKDYNFVFASSISLSYFLWAFFTAFCATSFFTLSSLKFFSVY